MGITNNLQPFSQQFVFALSGYFASESTGSITALYYVLRVLATPLQRNAIQYDGSAVRL